MDAAALEDALRSLVIPWQQTPAPASAGAISSTRRPIGTVAMPMLDRQAIEASASSREFRRFEDSWSRCQGMRGDFFDVVRLLHATGCSTEAEHLLRSNLFLGEDDGRSLSVDGTGLALYEELFGKTRREEFGAAIAAFVVQFAAPLRNGAGGGFFVGFDTRPQSACLDPYRLRDVPCAVHFEYGSKTDIESQLWSLTEEDQLIFLRWRAGVWEVVGAGVTCSIGAAGQ